MIDLVPQTGQSTVSVSASTTYDDMGRITSTSDPDRGSHTLTYDPNGKILTDVSGTRTLGYNYDLLGRTGCVQDAVPTINATGACTSGTHPYIQNTYDTSILGGTDFPIGQLTQSLATTYLPDGSTATATNQARYDQRGRTTESKLFIGVPGAWNVTAGIPGYQQDQTYNDANQNVTNTFTSTGGDSSTTTQVYDTSTGISTGLSNNGTATADLVTISYNSHGLLDTLSFLSTTGSQLATEQFGYDANFRPVSANAVWQVGSGTSGTIANQSRTYDPNGNVTSLSITQATVPGAISSGGTETQNFCYDEQDRMVWSGNGGSQPGAGNGVCGTGTLNNTLGGAGYTNSFVYTHLGQIWQAPLNGDSSHQYQYLYCDSAHPHQLTGVYQPGTTCATKSTSNQVYTSSDDAWGNVTSRWAYGTASTLSYDGLDHMTQWTSGSNSESYVYDASGQRILRRLTNNSTTQFYTYPFGMSDFTYNSAGGKTSSTFYYRLGGTLIGTLSGESTSFLMIDGLGSPLANISSTAGSAKVLGNQGYGPYGTRRYQQGMLGTAKGFTGQYADDLSGLDYYVSRYYDPVVGRFLSADVAQGNLAGMDPYGYVNGNPETKNDPTGKMQANPEAGGASPTPPSHPKRPTGNGGGDDPYCTSPYCYDGQGNSTNHPGNEGSSSPNSSYNGGENTTSTHQKATNQKLAYSTSTTESAKKGAQMLLSGEEKARAIAASAADEFNHEAEILAGLASALGIIGGILIGSLTTSFLGYNLLALALQFVAAAMAAFEVAHDFSDAASKPLNWFTFENINATRTDATLKALGIASAGISAGILTALSEALKKVSGSFSATSFAAGVLTAAYTVARVNYYSDQEELQLDPVYSQI